MQEITYCKYCKLATQVAFDNKMEASEADIYHPIDPVPGLPGTVTPFHASQAVAAQSEIATKQVSHVFFAGDIERKQPAATPGQHGRPGQLQQCKQHILVVLQKLVKDQYNTTRLEASRMLVASAERRLSARRSAQLVTVLSCLSLHAQHADALAPRTVNFIAFNHQSDDFAWRSHH